MSNILKKMMGTGLLALAAMGTLSAGASDSYELEQVAQKRNFAAWQKMQAIEGKCQIAFPDAPEHMQQTMVLPEDNSELTYHVYVSGLDQSAVYMVLIAEYPTQVNSSYAEMSLEAFLNGILTQNPHNRLVFADLVDVDGNKGLDFFVTTKDIFFKGRAVIANGQLYLLAMECEQQNYHDEDFHYFIDSFQLLK